MKPSAHLLFKFKNRETKDLFSKQNKYFLKNFHAHFMCSLRVLGVMSEKKGVKAGKKPHKEKAEMPI